MELAGQLYIPDGDRFFRGVFTKTGDKFDFSSLMAALKHVQDWRYAVEVGAHVGSWTRVLSERFDKVMAFEPTPDNFGCLARNTSHLKNVTLMSCAIGAEIGRCSMQHGPENSGQAHVMDGSEVPVYPLDMFGLETLDFLKIDAEGFELPVIEGARETISRCQPVILIEENGLCSRYGIKPGAAGHALEDMGYTLADRVNKDFVYVC